MALLRDLTIFQTALGFLVPHHSLSLERGWSQDRNGTFSVQELKGVWSLYAVHPNVGAMS